MSHILYLLDKQSVYLNHYFPIGPMYYVLAVPFLNFYHLCKAPQREALSSIFTSIVKCVFELESFSSFLRALLTEI